MAANNNNNDNNNDPHAAHKWHMDEARNGDVLLMRLHKLLTNTSEAATEAANECLQAQRKARDLILMADGPSKPATEDDLRKRLNDLEDSLVLLRDFMTALGQYTRKSSSTLTNAHGSFPPPLHADRLTRPADPPREASLFD